MRAACPTPVSVVEEEIPTQRSVGGFQSPILQTRTRVTKGCTCRRSSSCDQETRDKPLPSTTNLRGTSLLRDRPYQELMRIHLGIAPAIPLPTTTCDETAMSMPRDNGVLSVASGGQAIESETEDDVSQYNLSVTGRNPVLSESNVVDCSQLHPIRLPTKALSAEDQGRFSNKANGTHGRIRKIVPMKSLNIGGLGLPFINEPHRLQGKDYKPGRIQNPFFDCFRCENRMSTHDNRVWFESILVSSRFRGTKRPEKVKEKKTFQKRKYSKDELSRALFPRYWSQQCLSPDSLQNGGQMGTPETRPATQTPDTISGPWKAGCNRPDSRDGMLFGRVTRADLHGFCGVHEKSKSGSPHQPQLAPCRPYYSDTQLGVNLMTHGDLWCHNADLRIETCPSDKIEVESHVTESLSRCTISRLSQNGKASRISVHSRDGHSKEKTSAFEFRMRIHRKNAENVFYKHHEDEEVHYHNEDVSGMTTVQVECSVEPNQMRSQCVACCHGLDDEQRYQMEEDWECLEDQGNRRCCIRNTTPLCRYSRTSIDQDDGCIPRRQYCSLRCYCSDTCQVCCASRHYAATNTHYDECPTSKPSSQIDCNTSAVDRSPSLEVKGKKASTGLTVRDIMTDLHKELQHHGLVDEALANQSKWQHTEPEIDAETISNPAHFANTTEDLQSDDDDEDEDDEEDEAEQQNLVEEQESCLFEVATSNTPNNQTYPDLPKPLGRYFCYVPIVDKRYNRWKRRKPKKKKRTTPKKRPAVEKPSSSSTSNESTTVIGCREPKRSKPWGPIQSRQVSRNEKREEEPPESRTEALLSPVFDHSDLAEETQVPDSIELCTGSSRSSLTSSGTRTSTEPNTGESFTSPSPVNLVDIADLCPIQTNVPAVSNLPRAPGSEMHPEKVLEEIRVRGRVASIPSKNYPRTQKSLLSLSLRGPLIEKEMSGVDPMQALPRAGGRLPLLKTQRSVLARSSDSVPGNHTYLTRMDRRLGWIKRGILQRSSSPEIVSLPKPEFKIATKRYSIAQSPTSPEPKPKGKNKSAIPRHSRASTTEKFSPVIRGQNQTSSKKRRESRSSRHDLMYLSGEEDEDRPTFTLKELLSTLPVPSDTKCSSKQQCDKQESDTASPNQLTNLFNNFVRGSPLHKRKLRRPRMDRSISALSFTPAFTFSIYSLPDVYRCRNVILGRAGQ